eukprot:Em0051g28a
MPQYKLIYFNLRGRAEYIRLIFAQADVQYKDERIKMEDWPSLKPKTPFGMLPVLEMDGKMLGGSQVIARYIAEKHGLAGKWPSSLHEKDECRKRGAEKRAGREEISDTFGHVEKTRCRKQGWVDHWLEADLWGPRCVRYARAVAREISKFFNGQIPEVVAAVEKGRGFAEDSKMAQRSP